MSEHRGKDIDEGKENSFDPPTRHTKHKRAPHRLSATYWAMALAVVLLISLCLYVYILGDDGIGHNIIFTPMSSTPVPTIYKNKNYYAYIAGSNIERIRVILARDWLRLMKYLTNYRKKTKILKT